MDPAPVYERGELLQRRPAAQSTAQSCERPARSGSIVANVNTDEMDVRASEPQALSAFQEIVPANADEPDVPAASWEGFREFWIQRRKIEDRNRSICSFYLVPIDGQPLPSFRPGQFLTFRLPIEDPVTHQPKTVVRCYTRRTWVFRFWSASFGSQGKASRRVIAWPMATSDNPAMGREGRAPGRTTQV
jgi:hypothetical protein